MALVLTEEQSMLRDSAHGLISDKAPVSHLRQLRDSKDATGFSHDLWKAFAEMGFSGLLVPETEREQRLMGPARDDLMQRAQTTASRVKDAAMEAGQELRETVREEVSGIAPDIKASVKDAAQAVGEQVKEKAGRVKEEAKQAAREQRPGRGSAPA